MIILTFTFIYYIYLIIELIRTTKEKQKGYYHLLFINIISGVIIAILNIAYPLGISNLSGNMASSILYIGLIMDIFLLITIIATIVLYKAQNKKKNLKFTKEIYLKRVFKFTIVVLLIVYSSQSIAFLFQSGGYNKNINEKRAKEIEKAIDYLHNKYDITLNKEKCIYFRNEKYVLNEQTNKKHYIPSIMIFGYKTETITVVDRNGTMSDNRQISELNNLISRYFSKKSDLEIDHVDINKMNGIFLCGNDNIINKVIQKEYNIVINKNNIPDFMGYVFKEKDLSIKLYIKSSGNKYDQAKYITKRLNYLKEYENIKEVIVYIYNDNLKVSKNNFNYKEIDDINDNYKFGCYYVESEKNNISYKLRLLKENNENNTNAEQINGWIIEN